MRTLLASVVSVALALTGATAGHAKQVKAKTAEKGSSWTAPCHAAMDDLAGYKSALIQHDLARQAFRTKFINGYYSVPGKLNAEFTSATPEDLVGKTAKSLVHIADDKTGLLVYAISRQPGAAPTLCVWLLGPSGMLAAETTTFASVEPVAYLARRTLRVETRAAARAPVPLAKRGRPVAPDSAAEPPELSLAAISDVLMPPSVKRKLLELNFPRLLVLPAADIGTVPWPALPLGEGMVVDRSALVILPDVDWILEPPWMGTQREFRAALIVGDPDLSKATDYRFPPLPGARKEAEYVAAAWSGYSKLLIGADAEMGRIGSLSYVESGGGSREIGVLYFATHGISDAENPMDGSFLALKGGHLFARRIKDFALSNRPLVVMSACQTGLGKTFDAGVFGLARAWWQAGAQQVVMSLWNVDDTATQSLMSSFMHRVAIYDPIDAAKGASSREEYLRQAMLLARKDYPDPALWASFLLFGMPTTSKVLDRY